MKITNKKTTKQQLLLINYAKRTLVRYQEMSKREKRKFLDQVEADFGGHRKSIIRLYKRLSDNKLGTKHPAVKHAIEGDIYPLKKKRGPKKIFHDEGVVWWLQTLWVAMNQVSEKLMHSMLPHWIQKCDDPRLSEYIKSKLLAMSPSTIERLIRSYKKENYKKLFCTTKPPKGKDLMIRIPTRVQNFQAPCCGYLEGDTVAHCGTSLLGTFAWTLNTVDHKSSWTEQAAFLSNTAEHVVEAPW